MDAATLVSGGSAPAAFWPLVLLGFFFTFLGYMLNVAMTSRRGEKAKDQVREDRKNIEEATAGKTKEELADELDKTLGV